MNKEQHHLEVVRLMARDDCSVLLAIEPGCRRVEHEGRTYVRSGNSHGVGGSMPVSYYEADTPLGA